MADQKEQFRAVVVAAINQFIAEKKIECANVEADAVRVENPPKPEMGDLGIPMFTLAKVFRLAPPAIAQQVAGIIKAASESKGSLGGVDVASLGAFEAVGPYVNIKLNKANAAGDILKTI
ncbi:MAG: hypothetical protein VZR56_11725 [Treponema sp.]|nr:hypothetical protein [Treponema sp.]